MNGEEADILSVNPLLSEEDVDRIRQKIYHYERLPKKEEEETVFHVELEQVNLMVMQIKTILRYVEVYKAVSYTHLLKRNGDAEHWSIYCMGTDYGIVYQHRMVSKRDAGTAGGPDVKISASSFDRLHRW